MTIPWQLISAVGAIIVFIDQKLESKAREDKASNNEMKESLESIKTIVLKNDLKSDKRITLLENELRAEVKRLDSELQNLKQIISAIDEAKGGA